LTPINSRDAGEIERSVTAFARGTNGGLIVTAGGLFAHRELIIALAAKYRLPACYSDRIFGTDGGLIAYGPDRLDQYRRAAGYVDRILRGEKPADLPVQAPTKYELAINLKTAKALGLTCPPLCSLAPTRSSNEAARVSYIAWRHSRAADGQSRAVDAARRHSHSIAPPVAIARIP
jgi:ABC-type uncharacterized transport system substrate-binding protein